MAFRRETIEINGCKLSYARGGAGEPLIYLHGTDGLAEWPTILDMLAERFDVIVPDHPGFGASEVPAWIDDVSDIAYLYLDAIAKQFGTLPGSLTEKNIRLFASEVMPAIKQLSDRDYRGFELPRVAAE